MFSPESHSLMEIEKKSAMASTFDNQNKASDTRLAQVTVKVPVHLPGNAIDYKEVDFDVFYDGRRYNAFPIVDRSLARLTILPASIIFTVKDNWVTCGQSDFKYVAVDIYDELKKISRLKVY
jgi:hypothetical protein